MEAVKNQEVKSDVKPKIGRPKKTTKEQKKAIQVEQWQNVATGEIKTFDTVERQVYQDTNFWKLFLTDYARILEDFGGRKLKVMRYILENIDTRNMLIATYDDLIKQTKCSRQTVSGVLRYLKKVDFLRERTPSVYMVSPRFIVQGSAQKRQNLMIKYNHLDYTEAEAKSREQQMEMFDGMGAVTDFKAH